MTLTHISLASFILFFFLGGGGGGVRGDIGKRHSPRCDAAEHGIYLGIHVFCLLGGILSKHGIEIQNHS